MEISIGKEMMNVGKSYMNQNIRNVKLDTFRPYFNISNSYILRKLILLTFPFRNNDWNVVLPNTGTLSTPDLYIPIMSFITFILLKGIFLGISKNFSPEKLSLITSRFLIFELIVLFFTKLISYFINAVNLSLLDLVCFMGYKYFVLCLLIFLNSKTIFVFVSIYLMASLFVFLSRTMRFLIFGTERSTYGKMYFLFGAVFVQVLFVAIFSSFY